LGFQARSSVYLRHDDRSDLKLQAIDRLRDKPDETHERPLALGEVYGVYQWADINAMDKAGGEAAPVNAACTLTLETRGNLQKIRGHSNRKSSSNAVNDCDFDATFMEIRN
jgi:hypothetical protein